PLPSAGGPGNGLSGAVDEYIADAVELAEKIGITVPDGDTTKMSNAADAWDRIANDAAVKAFPEVLDAAANAFQTVTAADASAIDEDLRAQRAAVISNIAMFTDLATACRQHRESLDKLRADLKVQLLACKDALMLELSINAAVSIASSWITFGVSVAAGVAGAAAICARYARPIRASIEAWRASSPATRAVRTEQSIARHTPELNRLDELKAARKPETILPKSVKPALSDIDRKALWEYTGPVAEELNWKMRHGALSKIDELRISDLNAALDKIPDYTGPVTRRLNLSAEDLLRYEEGKSVTEAAFTSSARTAEAAFDRNVEMQ
ncbi:hypothetical protein, partial [Streptomyces roseolus]|uniref:hypothetical protein n=1 Tax=Streptomyces roseolus TaxID=67358 RepID=UPI003653F533